jgi:hypothetical protein
MQAETAKLGNDLETDSVPLCLREKIKFSTNLLYIESIP